MRPLLVFLLALALGTGAVRAAAAEAGKKDDIPLAKRCAQGGGDLNPHQQAVYKIYKENPILAETLDPTCAGVGLPPLIQARIDAAEKEIVNENKAHEALGEKTVPPTVNEVLLAEASPKAAPNKAMALGGIQLRGSIDQVTDDADILADSTSANKAFDKADPAIFSYSYDKNAAQSTWTAKGVLAYPILSKDKKETLLVPSIDFDRLADNKPSEKHDSLILRLGKSFTSEGGHDVFESFAYRVRFDYATEFSLEKKAPGGEFEWEPLISDTWLRGNQNDAFPFSHGDQPGWLAVQWRAFLHLEGGDDLRSSVTDAGYLRMGPHVELDFIPVFEQDTHADNLGAKLNGRLRLALTYLCYPNALDGADASLFTGKLVGYFDRDHHVGLTCEYDNGVQPVTAIQDNRVLVSLGLKF